MSAVPYDLRRERRTPETDKPDDTRTPAQRDHDRIVYSSAFRRLAGVTQVVSADQGHVFHNRLTHSLKVGQLARRLAQRLLSKQSAAAESVGGLDPDVTEAGGLAHDLGHPPFGHIAEEELRDLVVETGIWDGFEGNAQSFRIVTKLARRSRVPGLNLTCATLNALLKYPWTRQPTGEKADKYGIYGSEAEDFRFARLPHKEPADERKCPEAELMDWADDVTYAVHDAEDFYRAGLMPLDRLGSLKDDSERRRFFDEMYKRSELKKKMGGNPRLELEQDFFDVITTFPIDGRYNGDREQRSRLRDFSSTLIGQFVNAIELNVPAHREQRFVSIRPKQQRQVRVLKALTWYYVIYHPSLATQQYGQRRIIRELFKIFYEAATAPDDERHNIFPVAFRDDVKEANRKPELVTRLVADLISGMSEQEVVGFYQRLTG